MSKTTLRLVAAASATAGLGTATASHIAAAPAGAHSHAHVHRSALTAREAANARATVDLLRGSFTLRQPRKYAEKYIDADTYIQHNPTFADGRKAFITGVKGFLAQAPNLQRARSCARSPRVISSSSRAP